MTRLVGHFDQLAGHVVSVVAREIEPPSLSRRHRRGTHKRMETKARRDVLCTIEQPFRFEQDREE